MLILIVLLVTIRSIVHFDETLAKGGRGGGTSRRRKGEGGRGEKGRGREEGSGGKVKVRDLGKVTGGGR